MEMMKLGRRKICFCILGACLVLICGAADLNCEFKSYKKGYTCLILARQVTENETIQIVGEHLIEMTNEDVQSVAFYGSGMKTISNKLFQSFTNLIQLDVQVSHLEFIDEDSFQRANKLQQLWATSNFVKRLEAESFVEAFNLQLIDLRSNLIAFVDEKAFKNLTKLEKLLLSQNNIVELRKGTFEELTSLKVIHMHSNVLETLEEGLFDKTLKLKEISLYNNQIKIIADDLFMNLPNLSLVSLSKNLCINKVYGEDNWSMLSEDIKNCSEGNSLEAQIGVLSERLKESKQIIISLSEDVEDLNSAYNWKLIEISKTKKVNENLEKILNRFLKVNEICENKNRQLESDLKRAFGLLMKESNVLN